jgi:hypothetical protein
MSSDVRLLTTLRPAVAEPTPESRARAREILLSKISAEARGRRPRWPRGRSVRRWVVPCLAVICLGAAGVGVAGSLQDWWKSAEPPVRPDDVEKLLDLGPAPPSERAEPIIEDARTVARAPGMALVAAPTTEGGYCRPGTRRGEAGLHVYRARSVRTDLYVGGQSRRRTCLVYRRSGPRGWRCPSRAVRPDHPPARRIGSGNAPRHAARSRRRARRLLPRPGSSGALARPRSGLRAIHRARCGWIPAGSRAAAFWGRRLSRPSTGRASSTLSCSSAFGRLWPDPFERARAPRPGSPLTVLVSYRQRHGPRT